MTKVERPEWVKGYPDYGDMVESWGYVVETFKGFGSYTGDYVVLLSRDDGRIGFLVIGYGSCSMCDAMESALPPYHWDDDEPSADWRGVVELSEDLRRQIHWEESREALGRWIDGCPPENHWWSFEPRIAEWLNENLGTHLRTWEDD